MPAQEVRAAAVGPPAFERLPFGPVQAWTARDADAVGEPALVPPSAPSAFERPPFDAGPKRGPRAMPTQSASRLVPPSTPSAVERPPFVAGARRGPRAMPTQSASRRGRPRPRPPDERPPFVPVPGVDRARCRRSRRAGAGPALDAVRLRAPRSNCIAGFRRRHLHSARDHRRVVAEVTVVVPAVIHCDAVAHARHLVSPLSAPTATITGSTYLLFSPTFQLPLCINTFPHPTFIPISVFLPWPLPLFSSHSFVPVFPTPPPSCWGGGVGKTGTGFTPAGSR